MKRNVLGIVAILTLITSCVGIDQPISLKLGRKEYFSQNRAPSYGSNTISKGNLKFSNENSFIIDFNDSFVSSKGKEVSIGVYSQIDEPLKLYHKYDVNTDKTWLDTGSGDLKALDGYIEITRIEAEYNDRYELCLYVYGNFKIDFESEPGKRKSVIEAEGSFYPIHVTIDWRNIKEENIELTDILYSMIPSLQYVPYPEKTYDFGFHDDFFYSEYPIEKIYLERHENEYFVMFSNFHSPYYIQQYIEDCGFTLMKPLMNLSEYDVEKRFDMLDEDYMNAKVTHIKGYGKVEDIPNIIFYCPLYSSPDNGNIPIMSNSVTVVYDEDISDDDPEEEMRRKADSVSYLLKISKLNEDSKAGSITFVCYSGSAGNPAEIANWLCEFAGFPHAEPNWYFTN
ncbi:MAG: hypothetical protein IKY16_01905 [Bacteroidales bacterium]|nr:hypothetical protein [Bacteroidales bacterium]